MARYLGVVDVQLIHKSRWDNIVLDALSRKEEFKMEKPMTKI
jgi:hypothetical protein